VIRTRIQFAVAAVVAVGAFAFVVAAVAPTRAANVQEADLELGKEIYGTQCAACHGAQGKGDGPAARFLETTPRDLTGGEWMYVDEVTVAEVAKIIDEGIPGTEMEPFGELLLEAEILAAAAYVIAEFSPE